MATPYDSASDSHALSAQFGNHFVHALLLDGAQAARRYSQTDETALGLQPEPLNMEVGQETATAPVVRVRHAIAGERPFAGDLADSGHGAFPRMQAAAGCSRERVALYTSDAPGWPRGREPRSAI